MDQNKEPTPLQWDRLTCADARCKLEHLLAHDPETDEVFGEVSGPDGLQCWIGVYKGMQVGMFRTSVAAMEALNRKHAASAIATPGMIALPGGAAIDVATMFPSLLTAMRAAMSAPEQPEPEGPHGQEG